MTAWAKHALALRDRGAVGGLRSSSRKAEYNSSEEAFREWEGGQEVGMVDEAVVGCRCNRFRLCRRVARTGTDVVNLSRRIGKSAVIGPI